MSDPKAPAPADPMTVLENTRRTLLKLVENIDQAIVAAKEPATRR